MNDLPQVELTAAIDSQGSAVSQREENITKRMQNKTETDIDKGTKELNVHYTVFTVLDS
jgi:hypothetical protein